MSEITTTSYGTNLPAGQIRRAGIDPGDQLWVDRIDVNVVLTITDADDEYHAIALDADDTRAVVTHLAESAYGDGAERLPIVQDTFAYDDTNSDSHLFGMVHVAGHDLTSEQARQVAYALLKTAAYADEQTAPAPTTCGYYDRAIES